MLCILCFLYNELRKIYIVMYAWAYLRMSSNPHVFITSCKTTLICINANLHGKLSPVALNVNVLVFIVFFNTSLHAAPYHSMCISIFQQKNYKNV